jgi:hypothetical protein
MNESEYGYDWAHEADFKLKNIINGGDFKELVDYSKQGGEMEFGGAHAGTFYSACFIHWA